MQPMYHYSLGEMCQAGQIGGAAFALFYFAKCLMLGHRLRR